MRRDRILSIMGLMLLSACTALLVLPASWMSTLVPQAWPLSLVDANGTIWSGSARIALGTPLRRRTIPAPIHWHWTFFPSPRVLLTHPWLGGPLTLSAGWRGISLSAQTLQLPAAALGTLDARIAAVSPSGEMTVTWPATFWGGPARQAGVGLLDVEWRNAVSALAPIHPLGDYMLSLKQGAGDQATLILSTKKGPLMLEGVGILNKQHLQFDGTAQADPAAGAAVHAGLRDLLASLGPEQNQRTVLRIR